MPDEAKRTQRWPSAVAFDLDGTLVDSAGDLTASLNELLKPEQLSPFRAEEAIDLIGNDITVLVQRAFMARGLGLEADELSSFVARFKTIYEARATDLTRPFAGVPKPISDLRMCGIAVGICTNKEEGLAQKIVEGAGTTQPIQRGDRRTAGPSCKTVAAPSLGDDREPRRVSDGCNYGR
jgi:phosphoglycolate phosphatase